MPPGMIRGAINLPSPLLRVSRVILRPGYTEQRIPAAWVGSRAPRNSRQLVPAAGLCLRSVPAGGSAARLCADAVEPC